MTTPMLHSHPALRAAVAATLLVPAGCWRAAPAPGAGFAIERVSPAEVETGGALLLNDSLTVYFSDAVDPLSVTEDSVTVLDAEGRPVRGALRTGPNWVVFLPDPPLTAELTDGSFRPGEAYRLVVAGFPRPDAVRAADGRRLDAVQVFDFEMAEAGPVGDLPAPLRPPRADLPFLLSHYDEPQQLPADAPRLRLHFSLPLLPASVRPEAFVVRLARGRQRLLPRRVQVVSSRLDRFPGSTVEIDLGVEPRVADRGPDETVRLHPGDVLSATLADDVEPLRDLGGNAPVPALAQWWSVVPGASLALVSWPGTDGGIVGDDPQAPGFESRAGLVRPRVRVEAGDGSLGAFRPRRDTVLRPGVPFDRGDGVEVVSVGTEFPFLLIDIGDGVRVRVEGQGGPVRLLAAGGVRIAGALELDGITAGIPPMQHGAAASEVIEQAPVALVAAGDVRLDGVIATVQPLPSNQTALTIASAGRIHLFGELPYNSVLAIESSAYRRGPAIPGARGQTYATSVTFTYGLPAGAEFTAHGASPWRQLAKDRDGGMLRHVGVVGDLHTEWQSVPENPVDPGLPDLAPERVPRPQRARDGDWIAVDPGSFVRFVIRADLASGRELPVFQELRLVDR